MKTKYLGIWMDHASAHLMELNSGTMETKFIESEFTSIEKQTVLNKGQKAMHHKEHNQQLAYYEAIGAKINNYQEVLLFGPTDARLELLNLLKADPHFDKINIETRPADKMTEKQEHAFVKDYFLKHLSPVK